MNAWERAEHAIRRGDFDKAASALRGRGLGLESLFTNTPRHDLLYSTRAKAGRISEDERRSWRRQAKKRRSAPLWALLGAAELAAGEGVRANRALSQALRLEPELTSGRALRAPARLN